MVEAIDEDRAFKDRVLTTEVTESTEESRRG